MIEISPKWKALSNPSRYFLCLGGRASSKSFSVSFHAILKTFELNERILYTRKTMTSAHLSIIPQVKEVIELAGLEDAFEITATEIVNKHTGGIIMFKGLTTSSGTNTAALKSLTGITTVIIDEFEEMNENEALFDKLDLSIRSKVKPGKIIMIMNPDVKDTWIYNRMFIDAKKNDCTVIHTTYLDNIDNLEDGFISRATRMQKVAPIQYEQVFLGAWREKADGIIYDNWITGDFEDVGISYFGLDFGFTDPDAMLEVKADKANMKLYVRELIYHTGLSEDELAEKVRIKAGNELVIADSANPKLIMGLVNKGLNVVPCEKGADSIRKGIKMLQGYEMIIDPESTNLIKELNNYVWDDKKSEVPIDKYNHLLDALRYATKRLTMVDFFAI